METLIQSLHFDADSSLRTFIYDKVQTLDKAYDRIENCNVILRLDKNDKSKNKIVELDLLIPGRKRIFASDQAETFEEAAALAIEEVRKQLVKHKEKLAENVDGNLFESDVPAI